MAESNLSAGIARMDGTIYVPTSFLEEKQLHDAYMERRKVVVMMEVFLIEHTRFAPHGGAMASHFDFKSHGKPTFSFE